MGEEETCNTTLGLGIGVGITRERQLKKNKKAFWLDLSLPLHPKIEANDQGDHDLDFDDEKDQDSFSSKTIDDQEEERGMKRNDCSNVDIYNNNNGGSRKKLKLTTEQITLLEDSFKIHSTLNTGQKQELANKLDLLPRQIEVWFQNRRARTKLKQIEQECELLKKCCETLSDENGRLKKELQEVRCRCSSKFDHHHHPPPLPLYIQCPTMAAMCHPYDQFGKSGEETKTAAAVNGGAVVQMHDDSNKKNATATLL